MCAATIPAKSVITSAEAPSALDQTHWHALEPHNVSLSLEVDPRVGLTPAEINERHRRHGPNALQRIQPRPAWRVLIDQIPLLRGVQLQVVVHQRGSDLRCSELRCHPVQALPPRPLIQSQVLGTVEPSATDWIVISSCDLLPIGIVEMTKFAFRQRREMLSVYG